MRTNPRQRKATTGHGEKEKIEKIGRFTAIVFCFFAAYYFFIKLLFL